MRAVLFRLWEQRDQTEINSDFDQYYRQRMESLIDKLKEKLN